MGNKTFAIALCICMLLSGTGCKKVESLQLSDIKEETVMLRSDGTVQSGAYELFEEPYYKEADLKEFINEEIDQFNEEHGEKSVKLSQLEVGKSGSKKIAKAIFTYGDISSYSALNHVDAKCYTMEEAIEAGVLPEILNVAADGSRVSRDEVAAKKDYKVLTIQVKADIILPESVQYYVNAMLLSLKTAETTGEELAVIVYK